MAAFEELSPFGDQPPHAFIEIEIRSFFRREPAQVLAFRADGELRAFGSNEHIAHILVKMRRLAFLGIFRNRMNIEIEWLLRCDYEAADARFFLRFATRHAQYIFIAIAMPAELQPFIEKAVVIQQSARAIVAENERAAGEVPGKAIAIKAARRFIKQCEHGRPRIGFQRRISEGELREYFSKGSAIHGDKMAVARAKTSARSFSSPGVRN